MKTYFVCFANSKKWNNRCIAGVKLNKNKSGNFAIDYLENNPRWIRPVSRETHGEINAREVRNINLLDIVQIETLGECPNGCQQENVYYKPGSAKVVSRIAKSKDLDFYINHTNFVLFLNDQNRIPAGEIKYLKYSLILIKPSSIEYMYYQEWDQLRGVFFYKDVRYDLPITDLEFEILFKNNKLKKNNNTYICLSVGTLFNNYHYKLIVGIITI